MRFSVDAHAIGRHLTGNEVYVRSLLRGFAKLDNKSEFIAYIAVKEASRRVPDGFRRRMVSRSPYVRLGFDLSHKLKQDQPDLVHVQYTAPLNCPVPVVVSVHDVSFLEYPEYFTRTRALQLQWTVQRTVRKAARILTPSEFSKRSILKAYGLPEEKVVV
ncbi:MAG: glycosyltransferase family 4 protein, partial [bacterium]|nr:glycosyltransferase family 4 protein [bacterium]